MYPWRSLFGDTKFKLNLLLKSPELFQFVFQSNTISKIQATVYTKNHADIISEMIKAEVAKSTIVTTPVNQQPSVPIGKPLEFIDIYKLNSKINEIVMDYKSNIFESYEFNDLWTLYVYFATGTHRGIKNENIEIENALKLLEAKLLLSMRLYGNSIVWLYCMKAIQYYSMIYNDIDDINDITDINDIDSIGNDTIPTSLLSLMKNTKLQLDTDLGDKVKNLYVTSKMK
jgi:hypothetical protein